MNQNYDDDLGFDLSGVSEQDDYTPFPPGDYIMQAVSVEVKDSNSGGRYVKARFDVLGPEHEGRPVFENFNIMNTNPQTVEIALKAIKQWVKACGYTGDERLTMGLLESMEGREFIGTVYVEKAKPGSQYGDKNRIRKFAPVTLENTKPQASQKAYAQATGKAAPAAATSSNKQPWVRG